MSSRKTSIPPRIISIAGVLSLMFFFASCGSSNNNSVSNAQAQAISQEVVSVVQSAMTGQFYGGGPGGAHESLSKIIYETRPETSSGCMPTSSGQTCTFPISYSGTCPSGGTISVSGDFNLTLNSSGTGSDSSALTVTPANCVVSNLTINGDPNVRLATTIGYTNGIFDFPVTMNESGAISYGPHPSGSCSLNVSLTLGQTSCSVSGTVCGHSVDGNC